LIALDKLNRSRQDRVWIDGEDYLIHTSFPYWIAFGKKFETMQKEGVKEFSLEELDYLYMVISTKDGKEYGIPEDRLKGYEELAKFFQNDQPLPHPGKQTNVKGIDWIIDSEYVYAAFLQQYKINLIEQDLHWHDFLSLFNGLTETKLNEIISARYIEDGKETTKGMKKLRETWRLETLDKPEPFKMR